MPWLAWSGGRGVFFWREGEVECGEYGGSGSGGGGMW